MKEERVKIKLAPNYINRVVTQLNKILDEFRIYGQEWNKEIIKELIISNLTKNTTLEMIKELEKMPISDWQD